MKLIEFNPNPLQATYELKHSTPGREGTTLKQSLVLTKVGNQWEANLIFDGFPKCETPDEAATKLGEWMYRLSTVIMEEAGNFGKIDLTKISLE